MKRANILLISFFVSYIAIAQSNFKPGYIITNTYDSIIGLIDFRTDIMNSQVCRFKADEKAEVVLYYPGSITKYRFINEGKYYISHSINIDNKTQQVFLEYLVSGIMNLYFYKDPVSYQEYYFFEDENGTMLQITKKPDEIVDMKFRTDQRYIGTLNYLFIDYPTIQKNINTNSFNRGSMINFTKEYHNLTCTTGEECIEFENNYKKHFIKFNFSIYGGLQIFNYNFKENELAVFGSTNYLFPMIGGQFSITDPRFAKSLSLLADVSFSNIKGRGEYNDGISVYKKYKFDAITTIGRLNLRFTYPSGNIRPVVECGLSYYHLFNRSSSMYSEESQSSINTNLKDNYLLPRASCMGFNCGMGLNYLIADDRALFCRFSFEQFSNSNLIQSGQLKLGIIFK